MLWEQKLHENHHKSPPFGFVLTDLKPVILSQLFIFTKIHLL